MSEPSPSRPAPKPARRGFDWRALLRGGVVLVLLVIAAGILVLLASTAPQAPTSENAEIVPEVEVMLVREVEAPRVWLGYGTARAKRSADVPAEVAGVVVERPEAVEPGKAVEEGTTLLRLEAQDFTDRATEIRSQLAALEADIDGLDAEFESLQESRRLAVRSLELVQQELQRFVDARESAGVNQVEIDRLTRQVSEFEERVEGLDRQIELIPSRRARLAATSEQVRAALRQAELNVRRTEIRSPLDGVLQAVDLEEGERATPGQRAARVVDLTVIEIPVRVPVSAAQVLRAGDPVTLTARAGGTVWEGYIERVAPEADAQTRTMTAFVVVEQEGTLGDARTLLPGQYMTARLSTSDTSARTVVPRSSIRDDRLLIVDDEDRVRPTDVRVAYYLEGRYPELHPAETQWAVLATALAPGSRMILSQTDALRDGARVEAVVLGEGPDGVVARGTGDEGGAQ